MQGEPVRGNNEKPNRAKRIGCKLTNHRTKRDLNSAAACSLSVLLLGCQYSELYAVLMEEHQPVFVEFDLQS